MSLGYRKWGSGWEGGREGGREEGGRGEGGRGREREKRDCGISYR